MANAAMRRIRALVRLRQAINAAGRVHGDWTQSELSDALIAERADDLAERIERATADMREDAA